MQGIPLGKDSPKVETKGIPSLFAGESSPDLTLNGVFVGKSTEIALNGESQLF